MDDILKQLLEEEQDLQFTSFNEETAWALGSQLVEQARSQGLPVTIDITRGIGQAVMTRFVLPFELLALLMLAGLMGAIYFARPDD